MITATRMSSPPNLSAVGATADGPSTSTGIISSASLANIIPRTVSEKAKKIEQEARMEYLRSKKGQERSFPEIARSAKSSKVERRYSEHILMMRNSRDILAKYIKVKTPADLIDRLENISHQAGMRFVKDHEKKNLYYISSDTFFLEVMLDDHDRLIDVRIRHECAIAYSCKELVDCLNNSDFDNFFTHLEGLLAIYQVNADANTKNNAFLVLQAMETDIMKFYQMQTFNSNEILQQIAESAVGIVLPRIGGHAMRLTYFVSPYDFINLETQEYENVSIDGINSKKLGLSVEVRLEASSAYKLPLTSTISFAKDPVTGIETGLPIYATLTQQNSMLFPAIYVLRLNKPLPVCCNTLQNLLGSSSTISQHLDTTSATNLLNLIVESTPDEKRGILQRQFFVNLPDSTHCYFFTQRNTSPKGTVLNSVPFTEAAQVPKIIEFLKKHALFYTLISSCVRPQSKMIHDMDTTTVVEVDGYSVEKIVVTVQHPYDESLATLEFELSSEPGSIDCKIFSLYTDYTEIAQKMKKFIKKSLSIPCTVRALLRIWEKQRMEMFQRGIGPTSGTGGGGSLIEATYGSSLASNMSLASDLFTVQSSSSSNITMARQMGLGGSANETCASSSNVSGYLQFKQENMMPTMRNEDFTDSSQLATAASAQTLTGILSSTIASITTSSSTNSLQPSSLISLEKIPQMMHTTELSKFNEIEIADKYKNIWKDKTPNLKSGQFSITPIETTDASMSAAATTNSMSQATQLDVKRSGGIEIIPLTNPQLPMQSHQSTPTLSTNETSIASTSAGNLQSTITITPINTINTASSSTSKDRTAAIICSSTSHTSLSSAPSITAVSMSSTALPTTLKRVAASDTDTILSISSNSSTSSSSSLTTATANATAAPPKEKKRKKKRDDSPMGPPDKVYSRQNSPSSSPKGAGSMSSTGALIGSVPAGIVGGPSPKHSPVYSSPKHTNTASNSPKSPFGTHSPKHGSSGKPSMSTLKSASSVSASNVGTAAAVTSAAVVGMKSREKEKSTSISTSASSLSGMAMATTATTVGGLIAPLSMPKSSHLGLSGMTAVNSLSQQLKNVASLNQYLSGYGSGGSSPSALSSSMSSAADMTTAVLGLRKSQSIPPPPPPPVNLTASGSSIGVSGAGAAVSSMMQMLQHLQQGPQLPLPHGSSERLIPSIIVSGSTAEAATATLSTDSTTSSSSVETLSSTSPSSSTEYRVRPSPEGLKLTINKTSISSSVSKSASLHTTTMSSLSSSLTSTSTMTEKTPTPSTAATATTTTTPPRSHTGLKPGVISGPASKIGRLSPGSSTSSVSSSPQSASPKSTTTSPTLASTISPTTSAAYSRTFPISKPVMRLMQYAASTTPLSYSQLLPPPPPTPETPTTTNMSSIEAFLSSHGLATNISFSQLTQRTSTMTSEALSMSAVRSTEFNTCKSVRSTSTSFLSPTPAQLFEQMHRSSAIQGFTLPTASTYGEIPLPSPTTVTFETPTSTISDSPVQQIEQHFSTSENIASSSSSAISSTTSRSKTGNNGNGKNRNK